MEAPIVRIGEHAIARSAVVVSTRFPTYQAVNCALGAAATSAVLGREVDAVALETALDAVRLPARFETINDEPRIIVDGSHNPQAAHTLATAIGATFGGRRPVVLLGMLDDKDAKAVASALVAVAASFAVTQSTSPRAVPAADLAAAVSEATGSEPHVFESVAEALDGLRADGVAAIVVTGSLTTAAEARRHVLAAL
jgi:dihydrofolate synthase/folylpolyglutamate synthase